MKLPTLLPAVGLSLMTGLAALMTTSTARAAEPADALAGLRPPAVPLVANDPYFSVWSAHDKLTDGPTTHWTGKPQRLSSLIRVDGKAFRLMGAQPEAVPAMEQTKLTVWPTRTVYNFAGGGVKLTLTFTTPLLPDDLMVASRPVTYLAWSAVSSDGQPHEVSVMFDAGGEMAVNTPDQSVQWERQSVGDLTALKVGSTDQPVLEKAGDDLRIDWGYFYVAADAAQAKTGFVPQQAGRRAFAEGKPLPDDVPAGPKAVDDGAPVLAVSFDLGEVADRPVERHVVLAYDQIYAIQYFRTRLRPYWRKDGADAAALLKAAEADYANLTKRCEAFDKEVVGDLVKVGGDAYAKIGVLSYRQALAAQKICADANGQPIMMSKENYSNGCIATVDILYPTSPLMLVFAPNMLKVSLQPIMAYSASDLWEGEAAPHDLGTYPLATGQVYGSGGSPMPVEESGNMLVLVAALCQVQGDADFAEMYWPTLTKWYNFAVENGQDPANQLTTDDFAGHVSRNANLSVKAIMGIAGYGKLCEMTGRDAEAEKAMQTARAYAKKWTRLADGGDHYTLAFGEDNSWSQKYNLVWDKLLGYDVFPPEVVEKETAYYATKMNRYGLPLDSRKDYTKLDWEMWTATLSPNQAGFDRIAGAVAEWASRSPDRSPMTDWYDTKTGKRMNFTARSVVGGNFIGLMRDKAIWQKYAARDTQKFGDWTPLDTEMPKMQVVAATAEDGDAPTWRYTTGRVADGWQAADFDDSEWRQGQAGFGTSDTPGARARTKWDSADIYLRRTFTLADGADLKDPHLWLAHDEDVTVYINGVKALSRGGYRNVYADYPIAPEAAATLKPGRNTIAVHCHQTGGGQYVDVGIVDFVGQESASAK